MPWSNLESPLKPVLHPLVYVEPKDRDGAAEDQRQLVFLRDARTVAPSIDIFAVPNAGKRSRWEAAKRKREGMKAGALDLVCTWIGGVAFVEFKDGRGMPDDNQIDRLNMYQRQGHPAAVVRTSAGALAWLKSVGAPVRLT